ncbi:hypothetical protein AGMMS49928_13930 [Spirochaetia bacterium]|nr:hypothetical protein AGMMS49928_13930 [Spirochaetia bacterium]
MTMLELKKSGCVYFETGGANPHLRKGKFKGLNDFKKSFGTFLHLIYGGEFEKDPQLFTSKKYKITKIIRKIVHFCVH